MEIFQQDVEMQHVVMKDDIHRIEQKLAGVEAKLSEAETRILRWMIPMLLAQTAVFAAIVRWMG